MFQPRAVTPQGLHNNAKPQRPVTAQYVQFQNINYWILEERGRKTKLFDFVKAKSKAHQM